MRFGILGPLEVWDDGDELQLGAGRQRALLAFLLLHANEVVSTDRLIDGLWGERAPATALKVVQGYVSQLRKVLPREVLVSREAGYVLRTTQTDVAEFERLVDKARSQVPAEAARTLRRALDLWRGRPLTDVEYEAWAQTEITRLEELRLAALEDRIDADLELGRHAHVVPELEGLVVEHPLRERLRGQLMLALYRSGRQADALEAYTDARRRLVDGLGIEPGAELQDLQHRILAHDPELGAIARPRPLAGRRRARWLVAVGALLLLGAAGAVTIELSSRGGSSAGFSAVVPDSLAIVDPATNEVTGTVPIPGGPSLVAAGRSFVWVVSDASRTVSSLAPGVRAVTHVVAPNATPNALAIDGDAVWMLDGNRRVLLRIDPTYGAVTRRIKLPRVRRSPSLYQLIPLNVASGAGALWVAEGSSRLLRVDPRKGRVSKTLDVGEPVDDVAVAAGSVWGISGVRASVFEIDTQARSVKARIRIVNRQGSTAPFPIAVAVGEGSVWVLNANTQTVSRIDPEFGGVTATIPLGIGRNSSEIAVGAGAVWVTNRGDGTVARIDPATNAVTTIPLGGSPTSVAVGRGHVWVTVQPGFRALPRTPADRAVGAQYQALPASSCSPVEFEGEGQPRFLIASDLPFQGINPARETVQMSDAIRFILAKRGFRAGTYSVGYQSCDDSDAASGVWNAARCKGNARAYASSPRVIGVVGSYNSGCSQLQIATLANAPDGPLAMVSPANTYLGLTRAGPGTAPGEPQRYYPRGIRNYARVVAADDIQGAANALVAKRLGVTKLFILHDGDAYGLGIAANVRRASAKLGIAVVGFERWRLARPTQSAVARSIERRGADGVFVGGTLEFANAGALLSTLRAVLGNQVRILTPDGFTPLSAFVRLVGPGAEGMTISFPAAAPQRLRGEGRRFVAEFERTIGRPVEAYSVAAAQATEVLLDAIARSDGTRASVTSELFKTKVSNGILGSFSFDRNGDTTAAAVTIYRVVEGKPQILDVITPPRNLVR